MAEDTGAQDAGGGAPAGDPTKEGSGTTKSPSGDDKDFVPKAQFLAALKSATEKYQALEVQLAEMRGRQSAFTKADEPAKRYTVAELNAAVAAQTITADQAEEIKSKQIREDAVAEAERRILGKVGAERAQERVGSDLEEYKRLAPEIMEDGSETRQQVREAFDYFVGLGDPGAAGDPRTLQTQLKAIRAVLGPIEKLRMAKGARRETEAHEETGGSTGGSQRRQALKTPWDSLDKRQKDFYEAKIRDGLYKDRAAVEAELSFARRPNSGRQRARA